MHVTQHLKNVRDGNPHVTDAGQENRHLTARIAQENAV